MFCGNCGAKIEEGVKICPSCQTPVEETLKEYIPSEEVKTENKKEKFGKQLFAKKKLVLFAAVLLAAVVIVVLGIIFIPGFFMRTFSSANSYFAYVVGKNAEDAIDDAGDMYAKALEEVSFDGKKYSVKTSAHSYDDLLKNIYFFSGAVGMNNISSAETEMEIGFKDGNISFYDEIVINDEDICNIEAVYNGDNKRLFARIPELTKTYLQIELEEVVDRIGLSDDATDSVDQITEATKKAEEIKAAMPSEKDFEKLLKGILLSSLSDIEGVERGKETLTVNGISQDVITLIVPVDTYNVTVMTKGALNYLLSDESVKNLIYKISETEENADAEKAYKEFCDEIQRKLGNLQTVNAVHDTPLCNMTYWVGSGDEIIGCMCESERYTYAYAMTKNKDSFGMEAYYVKDNEDIRIIGEGLIGSKLNGNFTIGSNGQNLFCVDVKDAKTDDIKDGELSGTYTFSVSEDFAASRLGLLFASASTVPLDFSKLYLEVSLSGDIDDGELSVKLFNNNIVSAEYAIEFEEEKQKDIDIPSSKDSITFLDENDLREYVNGMDFGKITKRLKKAGFPEKLIEFLENL